MDIWYSEYTLTDEVIKLWVPPELGVGQGVVTQRTFVSEVETFFDAEAAVPVSTICGDRFSHVGHTDRTDEKIGHLTSLKNNTL